MNFSSYQKKIAESIELALYKNKSELINDFKLILSDASKLFKASEFDFWLREIGRHPISDLPVTLFGVQEARSSMPSLKKANRNMAKGLILGICENLFTYSNENDMCMMQGDFHYYFNTEKEVVYKVSQMGVVEPYEHKSTSDNYRIALLSEIGFNQSELYD